MTKKYKPDRLAGENRDEELASAIAAAIEVSLVEFQKIERRVATLDAQLATAEKELGERCLVLAKSLGPEEAKNDVGANVSALLGQCRRETSALFTNQRANLSTFNIVLFGRTGAGKSSLISALTRGNGDAISGGESDWTTDVRPIPWRSCLVYDTPGINGWGRTQSRADLESKARKAVEVADVVFMCFDNQNQQADEFTKLAEWVQTYQKPVVAVLNFRNPVWRLPRRVPSMAARERLSQTVREHASNIRDELGKIGLHEVPIVAISSKLAVFARSPTDFEGPDKVTFQKQRESIGPTQLLRYSNLESLEALVGEALRANAKDLRLWSLTQQLRGVLAGIAGRFQILHDEAVEGAKTLEGSGIERLLVLLGYPRMQNKAKRKAVIDHTGRDLLEELEEARGGRFQAPTTGEYATFIEQRLQAELGPMRNKALATAEDEVVKAFARGRQTTSAAIQKGAIDLDAMKKKAEAVLVEGHKFLTSRAKVALRDVVADFDAAMNFANADGGAGKGYKYGSWALRVAGALSGTAAAMGGFALANFWNPAGWTAGVATAVMLVSSGVAALFSRFSTKSRDTAEEKRLKARQSAMAKTRDAVHKTFDTFLASVVGNSDEICADAAHALIRPVLAQALRLRAVEKVAAELKSQLSLLEWGLAKAESPQTIVKHATTAVEGSRLSDGRRSLWFGEDWIDDPEGLVPEGEPQQPKRNRTLDQSLISRMSSGLRGAWARIMDDHTPSPGSGIKWLQDAHVACHEDTEAMALIHDLEPLARQSQTRILLAGPYSTGKSSFIKRLLIEAGQSVPEGLHVRGDPTTTQCTEYPWEQCILIDSPGVLSGDRDHTAHAEMAVPKAAAVILLFKPNLVSDSDSFIDLILKGDQERGYVPKLARTLFVINRADELGGDPELDPQQYEALVERKTVELVALLASRGFVVPKQHVTCMASDPFGLVGDRRDIGSMAFEQFREWDGFREFVAAYNGLSEKLGKGASDRSILEAGTAHMATLSGKCREKSQRCAKRSSALSRVEALTVEALAEAQRIQSKLRQDLERLLYNHTAGLASEIAGETKASRLNAYAKRLEAWWTEEDVKGLVTRWGKESVETILEWHERTAESLDRRLSSKEFKAAFAEHKETLGAVMASEPSGAFASAAAKVGRGLGAADRGVVYAAGKFVGFNFAPWGAVNAARILGQAGAVLGVAAVALDIFMAFRQEKAIKERDEARLKLLAFLNASVPRLVETITKGTDKCLGLIHQLKDSLDAFEDLRAKLVEEREAEVAQLDEAEKSITRYEELRKEAEQLLGWPWGKHDEQR